MVRLGQRKTPTMGFIEPPPGLQVDRSHHPGRRRSSADDRVSSSITHQTFMKEPPPPPSRRSSRDLQVYSRISSDSSGRARHSGEPPQQLRQRRASSERRPSRPFPPPPSSEEVHDFRQNRAYAEYPNDSVEYGHELVSTSSKYAPSSYVSDNRGPEGPPNQTQPARIPSDRKLSRELSKKKVSEAPQVPQEEESEYKSTKSQTPTSRRASKEYPFPVKCFLLKRDPHDVSLNSNGVGMKLVGGKELPGSNLLAAYVSKIVPGSVADTFDDIYEGDVVLEWNGASLENKTFEEVASILHESLGEKVSVVMRSDYNIQTGKPRPEDSRAKYSKRTSISSSRRGLSFSSQSIYEPQQLDEGEDSGGGVGRSRCGSYVDSEGGAQLCGDEPGERMLLSSLAVRKDSGGRMVKSPSSSTEATTTSVGTSSIHQSTNVLEDVCSKVSHHLAIPSEIDLRKRSTTSLPPSLADARDDPSGMYSAGHYGRKGSENLSVKSMGQGEIGKSKRHHRGLHGLKKGTYGSVQLQICHDPKASILYVTVLRAKLPKQRNDGADHVNVDPYVTVYLLPDKVLENQRRTRHYPMCSSPQFNQTMVYPNITVSDLKLKYLEVSAKNYNPTGDEDSLFGKVILYLSDDGILDEQPHTYSLRLEDKPFRRKSSPTQWKSQHSLKPTESKESCDPNVVSPRCSFTGEKCNELPQQESSGDAATTSRSNSRYALGKIAIFNTGNIPGSSAVVPTDCHGAFCSIL